MKCIVCDRCKQIIENPRNCRVITCAKPLKPPIVPAEHCKTQYRGNDRQQNDILWEKEVCLDCLDALEEFFAAGAGTVTPPEPEQPDNPGGGDEQPEQPTDQDEGGDGGETSGETGGEGESTQWM